MNESGRPHEHNGGPGDHGASEPVRNGTQPTPDPAATASPAQEELPPPRQEPVRIGYTFTVDGETWLALPAGVGAYGTGHAGLAALQAIHFARSDAPDVPLFEALIAAGRFDTLYESELVALFRSATRIVLPEPGAAPRAARFRRGEGLF